MLSTHHRHHAEAAHQARGLPPAAVIRAAAAGSPDDDGIAAAIVASLESADAQQAENELIEMVCKMSAQDQQVPKDPEDGLRSEIARLRRTVDLLGTYLSQGVIDHVFDQVDAEFRG